MGKFSAAFAISLLAASSAHGQVVRPTVKVPILKPTIKVPAPPATPPAATTESSGHVTIPANFRTSPMTVTGTGPGAEPATSAPVTIAEARDFNITVPIRVSHLPAMFTDVVVKCQVSAAANPSRPTVSGLDHLIADGTNSVHLVDGGYAGDIEVHPFTVPGYDPSTGQIYHCWTQFMGNDRGSTFTARPTQRYPGAPWTYEPPIATTGALEAGVAGLVP